MKSLRSGEAVVSTLFLALGVWVIYQTLTTFDDAGVAGGDALSDSALFPRIAACIMIFLALVNIIKVFFNRDLSSGEFDSEEHDKISPDHLIKGLLCVVVFVVYLLVLKSVGYDVATPVLMALLFYILGARWWSSCLLGLFSSIAMSLFFEQALDVILPVGIMGLNFNF
ncbi:tripartite tricarboxylate transporter TctB family protein [Marinobacterium nitratireducens]|uniref:tripartite tricarboxylate transporter TctB family protein n=1 Tax=Marinobacterium nitratireducens TaxID=518897 RepID=UPI00166A0381|nr:tripartite tricarboxylate transporter TctB family protein [Marinobacterium nitratireducens]